MYYDYLCVLWLSVYFIVFWETQYPLIFGQILLLLAKPPAPFHKKKSAFLLSSLLSQDCVFFKDRCTGAYFWSQFFFPRLLTRVLTRCTAILGTRYARRKWSERTVEKLNWQTAPMLRRVARSMVALWPEERWEERSRFERRRPLPRAGAPRAVRSPWRLRRPWRYTKFAEEFSVLSANESFKLSRLAPLLLCFPSQALLCSHALARLSC